VRGGVLMMLCLTAASSIIDCTVSLSEGGGSIEGGGGGEREVTEEEGAVSAREMRWGLKGRMPVHAKPFCIFSLDMELSQAGFRTENK
jgi:hypothetical protein